MNTLTKGILKGNSKFKSLSKAEKRVQIAKDVIVQIKLKFLMPQTGNYFQSSLITRHIGEELQSVLSKLPSCNVCAIGSLFVCDVMRTDNFKVNDYMNDDAKMKSKLKYFSLFQLELMETAFEKWVVTDSSRKLKVDYDYSEIAEKAIKFGKRYRNSTNRLIAIMENIILNKGNFKP